MVMVHLKCPPDQRQAILDDLVERDGFCDCSLVSGGGRVFPAHRLVLGAISPLCLSLMRDAEARGDIREDHGRVELYLPDFSPQVLEDFLQVIYGLRRDSVGEAGPLLTLMGVHPSAHASTLLHSTKPDFIKDEPSLIPVSQRGQKKQTVARRRSQRSRPAKKTQIQEESDEDWMPELERGAYPLVFANQLLSDEEDNDEKEVQQRINPDPHIEVDGNLKNERNSGLWSMEECRSMLNTVGAQLDMDWSEPIHLTNPRSQLAHIKRDSAYRALSLSTPRSVKELKESLKGKMERLTTEQLHHIMSSEKMLPVMARTEARGLRNLQERTTLRVTICSNITSLEMEEVILVCFPSKSKALHFKQIVVNADRITDCAKIWVDVLLDVWCTSRPSLPRAEFLLDRFQSVTEPMTVYFAAKSVLDSRQVVCSDCGETFPMVTAKKREAWNRHQEMHKLQKFECDCDVSLNTNVEKENHVKLFHCNGKYLKCADCEFIGSEKELSEHRNFNHQTYICDICGTVSMNLKRHNGHLLTHRVSKCDVCGEEFQGPSKLFRHKSNVHGKDFSCEDCGHVFKGRLKWMLHKKRAHEEGARFICDLCGQSFNRKLTMKRHKISVHIKNRPFVCRYGCGADYNDECNLRTHEKRRHGGVFKQGSFLYIYKNI
ncbi:hypothetical protein TCAL_02263 [Tigriopus californicus]|uniref:BTB domain-containing protein n=1 Tax=Tigriopus californicus TaxID=6832 RepID=A0A553PP09_TIGCA|nr:hypothetical protein TCAL_02263 [Tigriopus californicus]